MKYWDYSSIESQIGRSEDACYSISASSLVLFLSALSAMECRFTWRGSSGALSESEKDDVDGWIDSAYVELFAPQACEDTALKTAYMVYRQELGTNGGDVSSGANLIPLNELVSDVESLISTFSSSMFKLSEAGLYQIQAHARVRNDSYKILQLYRNQSPYNYVVQGAEAGGTEFLAVLDDTVELDADVWYELLVNCGSAKTGNGLGQYHDVGLYEHYAGLRLTKIE